MTQAPRRDAVWRRRSRRWFAVLGLGLVVVNLVMGIGRIADGSALGGGLTIAGAVFWAFYA